LWHKNPSANDDGMAAARRAIRSLEDPPRFAQLRRNDGNRFSANRHACHWLRKLETLLKSRNIELDLVLVVSADNPADCPSRGSSVVDPERLRRGLTAVEYHREGKRFSSEKLENLATGLRHKTPKSAPKATSAPHSEEELDELFLQMLDPMPNLEDPPWPAMKRVRRSEA
jgi:hypothetical protein